MCIRDSSYTGVRDDDLSQLKALPALKTLGLGKTRITGTNLAALLELPMLQALNLSGNSIDDSAIPDLARFTHLKQLGLAETKLSAEGLQRLQTSLPTTQLR